MVSVYISNDKIQAVCAVKRSNVLKVSKIVDIPLAQGCVSGGWLINTVEVTECLKELCGIKEISAAKIRVVLDSGAVNVKRLSLPNLHNEKYIRKLISEGFSEVGTAVYDYKILSKSESGLDVLAVRAEESVIAEYVEAFSAAGLKIGGIDIGLCGLIRLAVKCEMLKNSSFAFAVIDGGNMTYALFESGRFRLFGRERISTETEALPRSVANSLPSSVRHGGEISAVLFAGIDETVLNAVREAMGGIKCALLPDQKEIEFDEKYRLCDCAVAVSVLI